MKYIITAVVVLAVIAGAFLGGYYARGNFSLFGSDTLTDLRELGGEHSRLIAELEAGEREYSRQLEFYRERARQFEKRIALDAERIGRLEAGVGRQEAGIDRATGGVEEARNAANRIGIIEGKITDIVRQLQN